MPKGNSLKGLRKGQLVKLAGNVEMKVRETETDDNGYTIIRMSSTHQVEEDEHGNLKPKAQ